MGLPALSTRQLKRRSTYAANKIIDTVVKRGQEIKCARMVRVFVLVCVCEGIVGEG